MADIRDIRKVTEEGYPLNDLLDLMWRFAASKAVGLTLANISNIMLSNNLPCGLGNFKIVSQRGGVDTGRTVGQTNPISRARPQLPMRRYEYFRQNAPGALAIINPVGRGDDVKVYHFQCIRAHACLRASFGEGSLGALKSAGYVIHGRDGDYFALNSRGITSQNMMPKLPPSKLYRSIV